LSLKPPGAFKKVFIILASFIMMMPAFAGTFYVRTDGNDSNSGLENAPEGAWATIQKAADTLNPGDTAEIQAGTYNEAVTITNSGTSEGYIVFRANGEVVVNAEGPAIRLDGANYIRLEGITCKSSTSSGISLVNANNNILVRNVSSSPDGTGIEADAVSGDNQLIGNITSQGTATNIVNTVSSDLPALDPSKDSGAPSFVDTSGSNQAKFAPDEIIVKFKKTAKVQTTISTDQIAVTGLSSIDVLHKKLNVTSMKKIFKGSRPKGMKLKRTALPTEESPDLSNIYKLKIGKEVTVPEAVEMYKQDPNVEYAEPNYIAHICLLPNDPYYYSSGSWGKSYQDLWGLHKIQASSAWDIKRGEDVIVAVIDTGLDYNHSDIDQNVWINTAEIGLVGVDDDGNGYVDDRWGWDFRNNDNNPIDDHGHGTHCSGTIAAEGNNGIGVVGVAYNARIMALKGIGAEGSGYTSDLAEAITYAADNNADILSLSWGSAGTTRTLEDAINYAHALGCVVVAAAGNDNIDVSYFYPANYVNVITVSAFNYNDIKAWFSNYGSKIDVAAPGVDILSLRAQETDMYGNGIHIVGQNYYRADGTSMACPHVSGVAALILSNHPEFTNEEVRQVLRVSADDVDQPGWDINSGYGRINAYKALLVSNPVEAKITSPFNFQYFNKQIVIRGTISGQFDEWRLYYSPVNNPMSEILLQSGISNEPNYIWDTTNISPGNYYMKLKVFSQNSISAVDIIGIIIDHSLKAEEWVARYNGTGNTGDGAYAIAVDASGNVYVAGWTTPGSYGTYYATIKYDTNGNRLWMATYNGNYSNVVTAMAVDASGNVYVTGWSTNGAYCTTIKYDANGNQIWLARYINPGGSSGNCINYPTAITIDASGNVYVAGYSSDNNSSSTPKEKDYVTIKYDTNGNQLWVARYGGQGNSDDHPAAMAVDASGNVYVTGYSTGSGTDHDYATIKYDATGNQLWVKEYNGPGNSIDEARAMAVDASGNVYVTGYSTGSGTGYDYATIKYDTNGNQLWLKKYNGSGNDTDQGNAIALDSSGNIYVAGASYGAGTTFDYATIKYDTNGNQLWLARYNGPPGNNWDIAWKIVLDVSGNVYISGWSWGISTDYDYATIKYDANGNHLWVARYNGPGNGRDIGQGIAVDASGNVYVAGYSSSYGIFNNYDFATIKYSQNGEIEGKITIQGRTNNSAPITFEVRNLGESTPIKTYNITTDSQGNFNLINAPTGIYDLTAKGSNSLRAKRSNIVVWEGQTTPNVNFRLLGGDANGDNSIGLGDMVIVKSAWLTKAGDTKWDWRADFNNDYSIGMGDLIILKNNWLMHGDD
jgi:uncharacterized delta-60 repeat protein